MGEWTKIEWTDHTFNPWAGCTKVSEGCKNCYAERDTKRHGYVGWGPGVPRRRTSAANWRKPLKWDRKAAGDVRAWRGRLLSWADRRSCPALPPVPLVKCNADEDGRCSRCGDVFPEPKPARPRVFCASWADWLDPEVPAEWLADLLELIAATPHLDWLLLTKRPGLWRERVEAALVWDATNRGGDGLDYASRWLSGEPPHNVWAGTSTPTQADADKNVPALLAIPARVWFLSCEPLLEAIVLPDTWPGCFHEDYSTDHSECAPARSWVIAGGESGPGARPMHPDWARSLRDQCQAAGVAFFFKQWGEWQPICEMESSDLLYVSRRKGDSVEQQAAFDEIYGTRCKVENGILHNDGEMLQPHEEGCFLQGRGAMHMYRVGKKAAGRMLDGRTWDEVPS